MISHMPGKRACRTSGNPGIGKMALDVAGRKSNLEARTSFAYSNACERDPEEAKALPRACGSAARGAR
jgi:hypothetical protein